MTDRSKLRLIHEALDDGRDPLLLEGLDLASVRAAEELAAVDAWLRGASPVLLADDVAEALAVRIEAKIGELSPTDVDFDPLAAPDFSAWGDLDERGVDDAEGDGPVGRAPAVGVEQRPKVVPIGIRAAATAPDNGTASPRVLASGDRSTSARRGEPRRGSERAAGFRAFVASAAVVLLAAIGTLVANRSTSSPDVLAPVSASRPSAAAPLLAEDLAEPLDEALAPSRPAPPFEPVAREQGSVARASRGSVPPPNVSSRASNDGLSELPADARRDAMRDLTPGSSRRARAASSAESPAAAAPAAAAPAAVASMASAQPLSRRRAGGGFGVASTSGGSTEDVLAGDVAADAEVDVRSRAWTQRVFACVPTTTRTLSTDVATRAGTIVRVTSIHPRLDEAAENCIRRAIVGQRQGLDRARVSLRWTRP